MRMKIYIAILMSLLQGIVFCQDRDVAPSKMADIIPEEQVFLQLNTNILLTGETLYYKLLCLLKDNHRISTISKIAYVELISADGTSAFRHKLKLENGSANSHFFIPASLSTGHYKLVAYTQWMNNNSKQRYFQKDLYIINPYEQSSNNLSSSNGDEPILKVVIGTQSNSGKRASESHILVTGEKIYAPRHKVDLSIMQPNDLVGNFILSVRKIDQVVVNKETKIEERDDLHAPEDFSLPELRGEIISGGVFSKESGAPIAGKTVALSIPDKNYIYKNVITDINGRFIFNLHENYNRSDAVVQLLDTKVQDARFILDEKSFRHTKDLYFDNVVLDPNIKTWLVDKSISNQIDNAYSASKVDEAIERTAPNVFYGTPEITYILDEYKRFPSVRETFVEVIEGAGIRRHKDNYTFKIYFYEGFDNYPFADYEPLVLVDGIAIKNNHHIIDYSPYKIDRISLIKGSYFYGPKIFNGIVDIRTKLGDFQLPETAKNILNIKLAIPQYQWNYFNPNYGLNREELKRIPDYRHQLLWVPKISSLKDVDNIECYTSDIKGLFEVSLEGYTQAGQYIKEVQYFEVK